MVAVTPTEGTDEVVRQCAELGIPRVWMHRSFGPGNVSQAAVEAGSRDGITILVGGCPMMFVQPDPGHRCMRWLLGMMGKLPRRPRSWMARRCAETAPG